MGSSASSEPTGAAAPKTPLWKATLALGVVGLVTVATAVALYFVLAKTSTTSVTVTPKQPAAPSSSTVSPRQNFWEATWEAVDVSTYTDKADFKLSDFQRNNSKTSTTGDRGPAYTVIQTPGTNDALKAFDAAQPQPVALEFPPGLTPYDATRTPPDGLGWCAFTDIPQGQTNAQLLTSLPNGTLRFGQVVFQVNTAGSSFLRIQPVKEPSATSGPTSCSDATTNALLAPVPTTDNPAGCLDRSAAMVGCQGVRSLRLSADGLRLYVGHTSAFQDLGSAGDVTFAPREVVYGHVSVFTRPGANSGSSLEWTFSPELSTAAPLGPTRDDGFGRVLDTAVWVEHEHHHRIWATCTAGSVWVMQEDPGSSSLSSSVHAWLQVARRSEDATTDSAQDVTPDSPLALASDRLLVCGAPSSKNKVYHFARSPHDWSWSYQGSLPVPSGATNFGSSVAVNRDGTSAVVGSQGAVYVFKREAHDTAAWSLAQTIGRPAVAPSYGVFGKYVHTDGLYRDLLISAGDEEATQKPALCFCSFQPAQGTFTTPKRKVDAPVTYSESKYTTRAVALTRIEGVSQRLSLVAIGTPDWNTGDRANDPGGLAVFQATLTNANLPTS